MCGLVTEARFAPYPKGKQVVTVASPALPGILRVGSPLSSKCRIEILVMLSVLAQVAAFLHPPSFAFLTWYSAWYSGGQRQLQSHFLTCSLRLCSSDAKVLIVSSQTFLCLCCLAFCCFLSLRPFVFTWLTCLYF